jgi:hypothetical protein
VVKPARWAAMLRPRLRVIILRAQILKRNDEMLLGWPESGKVSAIFQLSSVDVQPGYVCSPPGRPW